MPELQTPPAQVGHPAYTAREPQDEAARLDRQAGPAETLAQAGTHAQGEDPSQPGADRPGHGVR